MCCSTLALSSLFYGRTCGNAGRFSVPFCSKSIIAPVDSWRLRARILPVRVVEETHAFNAYTLLAGCSELRSTKELFLYFLQAQHQIGGGGPSFGLP